MEKIPEKNFSMSTRRKELKSKIKWELELLRFVSPYSVIFPLDSFESKVFELELELLIPSHPEVLILRLTGLLNELENIKEDIKLSDDCKDVKSSNKDVRRRQDIIRQRVKSNLLSNPALKSVLESSKLSLVDKKLKLSGLISELISLLRSREGNEPNPHSGNLNILSNEFYRLRTKLGNGLKSLELKLVRLSLDKKVMAIQSIMKKFDFLVQELYLSELKPWELKLELILLKEEVENYPTTRNNSLLKDETKSLILDLLLSVSKFPVLAVKFKLVEVFENGRKSIGNFPIEEYYLYVSSKSITEIRSKLIRKLKLIGLKLSNELKLLAAISISILPELTKKSLTKRSYLLKDIKKEIDLLVIKLESAISTLEFRRCLSMLNLKFLKEELKSGIRIISDLIFSYPEVLKNDLGFYLFLDLSLCKELELSLLLLTSESIKLISELTTLMLVPDEQIKLYPIENTYEIKQEFPIIKEIKLIKEKLSSLKNLELELLPTILNIELLTSKLIKNIEPEALNLFKPELKLLIIRVEELKSNYSKCPDILDFLSSVSDLPQLCAKLLSCANESENTVKKINPKLNLKEDAEMLESELESLSDNTDLEYESILDFNLCQLIERVLLLKANGVEIEIEKRNTRLGLIESIFYLAKESSGYPPQYYNNKPAEKTENKSNLSFGEKALIFAAVGGISVLCAPAAIAAIGFGSGGIVAGTYAATMMSTAAIANGGGVAAGSMVALLQSAGVLGISATSGAAIFTAGGAVGVGAGAGLKAVKNIFKECPQDSEERKLILLKLLDKLSVFNFVSIKGSQRESMLSSLISDLQRVPVTEVTKKKNYYR